MRKKFFVILLSLIAGIALFINFERINPIYVLLTAGIFLIILFLIDKKLMIIPIGILIGFSLAYINFNSYKLKDQKTQKFVISILEKRVVNDDFRYIIDVKGPNANEKSVFFTDEDYEIGEQLLVKASIDIPNKNTNPNLFNYRNYLLSKGIASTIKIEKGYKKSPYSSIGLSLKNKFYKYIHSLFESNLSKKSSDFAISVILGENLIQNEDIKDLGLAHILAVSGLHIDMLIAFILYIFKKMNINYKYGYGFSMFFCLVYGYLISFPFSVIRVLIIDFIGFLAFLFQKPEDKLKSLILAAILILCTNPFAIFNAGFILSFIATSGVYLVYPKLEAYLRDGLIFKNIGFTTSIQLSLFPFIIYYYGKVNLIGILANFLIVPIFTITMYGIFVLILSYPLLRILISPLFKIIDYLLTSILNLTSLLNRFTLLSFEFTHPNILVSIYFYILILVILYMRKSNKALVKQFYIFNIITVFMGIAFSKINPETSFTMIDIGQGDAFLINDSGDYYLIDVGGPKYKSYDSGEKILVPYLKSIGVKEIKAIFISHEDKDHSGNLEILNNNFKIDNIITGPYNLDGLKIYNPIAMQKNNRINLKNGYIDCVFEGSKGEENAESLGLLINIEGINILDLGDLPKEYEDGLSIRADILKVSHHGSRTSTSRKFVESVNPKIALISAGRDNRYGHPTAEVLSNLDGVRIYNTQESGMVKIVFGKNKKIESYLKGGYFR